MLVESHHIDRIMCVCVCVLRLSSYLYVCMLWYCSPKLCCEPDNFTEIKTLLTLAIKCQSYLAVHVVKFYV